MRRKKTLAGFLSRLLVVGTLVCSITSFAEEKVQTLRGFTPNAAAEELRWEEKFKSVPSPSSSERHLRRLTEEPHLAGTKEDRALVDYIAEAFKQYGLETEVTEYHVYLSYPKSTELTMVEPKEYKAFNKEEGVEIDKDSYDSRVPIPFNGYSASGDVTEQIVYANYGLPDDYRHLQDIGVSVKGKIVLVRYGRSFRGIKVMLAEAQGAVGVLIYSDPQDDGYVRGDVYPRGPWRPSSAVQRGSVQFLSIHPGDPLTPGWGATKGARRLKPEEAKNIPHIPAMPVSYRDAAPLLQALAGPVVPSGWQGGLPFTYHIGPGPTKAHLKVVMDNQVRPIWNVTGVLRGAEEPEKVILLGNHHDAWVYGAVDPSSGTTALLETARALGALGKEGFRPRRTITLAAWGGEEYGLLGSTEWAEDRADLLQRQCVAYLNVDVAVSGEHFTAETVGSLKSLVREVTQAVSDPRTGKTVYQAWLDRSATRTAPRPSDQGGADKSDVTIGSLGSGSDYTVFLDHLGIPALSMGFGGDYGVYHSVYDNFTWMKLFGDPTWRYHPTMARVWGLLALRLSNAQVLPFDFAEYARDIARHAEDLARQLKPGEAGPVTSSGIDASTLPPLQSEAKRMADLGEKLNARMTEWAARPPSADRLKAFNEKLMRVERQFIDARGLPKRPWYRHLIYAPGYYTGYASKPLPGVTEAADDHDGAVFRTQLNALEAAVRRANAMLSEALDLAK